MRVLPAFLLLLSTGLTALARPGGYLHARKPAPVSRALKQHHVLRSFEDTCGHLDGNAFQLAAIDINLDLTADILGILLGLDICICISLLPLQVDVGLGLDALIPLLGLGDINALLEAALNIGPVDGDHCTHCTYPPHATAAPTCGDSIGCGWGCEPPFVKEGDQCVCPFPWKECNGRCGPWSTCSSGTPWKRDTIGKRLQSSTGVALTLADAQATCGRGETVCGVYGGSPRAFECLNVNSTLESCGGCTIPNPFLSGATATGTDCSAIPGVNRVSCVTGRCAVYSCGEGWVVNSSGDGCVRANAVVVQNKRERGADPLPPLVAVAADVNAAVDVDLL